MDYVFGRPREHDRDAIGQALIDWAKLDDSINLNKFCALNGLPPSYLTIWSKQCPNFHKAYEYAKTFIGFRREEKLNDESLHVKAYDLNAKTYDYFLNEQVQKESDQDTEKKKYLINHEHKLKVESSKDVPEDILHRFEAFIGMVKHAQSDRSIADKSTKAEDKS